MSGFSPRNLKYMRKFAESWPDRAIVQGPLAQIPWRSNLALLDKLQDVPSRLWYAVYVEYALDGYNRPMGVAEWETSLTQSLPEEFKSSLRLPSRKRSPPSACGLAVFQTLQSSTEPGEVSPSQFRRRVLRRLVTPNKESSCLPRRSP